MYVYAMGMHRREPTLVVMGRTRKGWRTRSTHGSADYEHAYESNETIEQLIGWMPQLRGYSLTADRQDAVEYLAGLAAQHQRMGRFYPDLELEEGAAVERVLQHLERD